MRDPWTAYADWKLARITEARRIEAELDREAMANPQAPDYRLISIRPQTRGMRLGWVLIPEHRTKGWRLKVLKPLLRSYKGRWICGHPSTLYTGVDRDPTSAYKAWIRKNDGETPMNLQ